MSHCSLNFGRILFLAPKMILNPSLLKNNLASLSCTVHSNTSNIRDSLLTDIYLKSWKTYPECSQGSSTCTIHLWVFLHFSHLWMRKLMLEARWHSNYFIVPKVQIKFASVHVTSIASSSTFSYDMHFKNISQNLIFTTECNIYYYFKRISLKKSQIYCEGHEW